MAIIFKNLPKYTAHDQLLNFVRGYCEAQRDLTEVIIRIRTEGYNPVNEICTYEGEDFGFEITDDHYEDDEFILLYGITYLHDIKVDEIERGENNERIKN